MVTNLLITVLLASCRPHSEALADPRRPNPSRLFRSALRPFNGEAMPPLNGVIHTGKSKVKTRQVESAIVDIFAPSGSPGANLTGSEGPRIDLSPRPAAADARRARPVPTVRPHHPVGTPGSPVLTPASPPADGRRHRYALPDPASQLSRSCSRTSFAGVQSRPVSTGTTRRTKAAASIWSMPTDDTSTPTTRCPARANISASRPCLP